ncbi:MAG: UTP--glucose-1-phosphate uridylyltransferase [Candidatus Odinarchaeia archaeon]
MVRKAVIPVAGLGTRLLPVTKEQPKEMLPIFAKNSTNNICVKPLVQMIFEQLYTTGFREFCFIVGRGKRAIEDHFTPDTYYISSLNSRGKNNYAYDLKNFYAKINSSSIIWVNQPEPKGFGDAVLKAETFVSGEPFLTHAGDTLIVSKNNDHIQRLIEMHEKVNADVSFIIQPVEDPRQYGVVEVEEKGEFYKVVDAVEKPAEPITNLAIMPVYIFTSKIFDILHKTKPGVGGELQLTDAIREVILSNGKVYAIKLRKDELRLDVGTPTTYWEALKLSYSIGGVFIE